ncbi:hypothetical protein NGY2020056_28060 [Vibrio cholerae]
MYESTTPFTLKSSRYKKIKLYIRRVKENIKLAIAKLKTLSIPLAYLEKNSKIEDDTNKSNK